MMFLPDFDCYAVLGVTRNSSHKDIVKAFRKLSREHHPDHGGDPDTFDRLQVAYRILGHRLRREEYDSLNPEGVLSVPEFQIDGEQEGG